MLGWDTAVWTGSFVQGSTPAPRPSALGSRALSERDCSGLPHSHPYSAQTLPTRYPTGASLCPKQHKLLELITTLLLAMQNPKGLIKIPLVAKPWVRSDFISEISEPDWPKQPTCLNGNGTSERPAFLFTPRLNKPPKSPQCERGQRKHPAGTPSPARHVEGAGL